MAGNMNASKKCINRFYWLSIAAGGMVIHVDCEDPSSQWTARIRRFSKRTLNRDLECHMRCYSM